MPHHAREGGDDLAALRIVGAHAAEPQAIFLGAVEDRQLFLGDELVALGRAEAERVAVAFEREKQLGAVAVLPLAGVHRAAAQADDDGDDARRPPGTGIRTRRRWCIGTRLPAKDICRRAALPMRGRTRSGSRARPARSVLGSRILPVLLAGQCSVQRPHSTQEYACRATICVRSLPVSRPKSSSPASGGILAKLPRERKIENGLRTRCRCLVCGISGRKTSSAAVCVHHSGFESPVQNAARYVSISTRIRKRDHAGLVRQLAQPLGAQRRSGGRTVPRSRSRPARRIRPRVGSRNCRASEMRAPNPIAM